MWKSSFIWHVEDMDLYAINYLHLGAQKIWYTIPPHSARKFEKLASDLFAANSNKCSSFLRHKTSIISTKILAENQIPYNRVCC